MDAADWRRDCGALVVRELRAHCEMTTTTPPLALLRGAATLLPRAIVARVAGAVSRSLEHRHPRLVANLAGLPAAVVHISPIDLPYRFSVTLGSSTVRLAVIDRGPQTADAEIVGDIRTLLDLLEGRIDGDSLFFRRDLVISGDTAVVVGLRNVLDREEIVVTDELGALCGPLRPPVRAAAQALDRLLDRFGARAAAMHRTLHPPGGDARDVEVELGRCRDEIRALTARLGALEARQKRREDRPA